MWCFFFLRSQLLRDRISPCSLHLQPLCHHPCQQIFSCPSPLPRETEVCMDFVWTHSRGFVILSHSGEGPALGLSCLCVGALQGLIEQELNIFFVLLLN